MVDQILTNKLFILEMSIIEISVRIKIVTNVRIEELWRMSFHNMMFHEIRSNEWSIE